jgi:hypothetical protein
MQNGKRYIGQTVRSLKARIKSHRTKAKENLNNHFYNALNKYGFENFIWTILCYASDKESLNKAEIYWIKKYKTMECGYNHREGGNGGKVTNETKVKLRESHMGQKAWNKGLLMGPVSDETKKKISEGNKGKRHNPETKKKLAEWHCGRKHTEISKKKMSKSARGRIPWNKGIPCSESTRKKISLANKGNIAWNKDKSGCFSEETLEKMRKPRRNFTYTQETRLKQCENQKRLWANLEYRDKMKKTRLASRKNLSLIMKQRWADSEYRKKMSESHMGQKAWNKNKTCKNISDSLKQRWRDPKYKEMMVRKMKEGRAS